MNSFFKKGIAAFLTLALIAALAGCGSSSNSASGNSKVTTLTFWNVWTDPAPDNDLFIKRVEDFNKSHPNIQIKMEKIPHDQYKIKVKTQAAGKQLPDLIQVWPGAELEPLANSGVIQPIDDLAAQWKDKLIPAQQLKDYSVDGKQYAIPATKQITSIVYYDKKILASVGYNEFPKTFDDFEALIKKLKAKGITPIALGNKGKWVLQSCYFSTIADRYTGSDFLQEVKVGKKKFTDPQFEKALQKIVDLQKMGAFNEDLNSIDNIQQKNYFLQGKAAMFIEGSWTYADLFKQTKGKKDLGLATIPAVSGGQGNPDTVSAVSGYGIALNSELKGDKKKAAEVFEKYFYGENLYTGLLDLGLQVPAKVEVPKSADELFKKELMPIGQKPVAPVYDAVLTPEETDILNNGLQSLTVGDTTPEKLAKDLQAAFDKQSK